MKSFLLTLIAGLFTFTASSAIDFKHVESREQWQQALDSAAQAGKLLFVDVYADWCRPCVMMDREVFSQPSVAYYFGEQFISVKVDGETSFGQSFAVQHQLSGYPTMFIIDGEGEVIRRLEGYHDASRLLSESGKALEWEAVGMDLWKKHQQGDLDKSGMAQLHRLVADDSVRQDIADELLNRLSDDELLSAAYLDFFFTQLGPMNTRTGRLAFDRLPQLMSKLLPEQRQQLVAQLYNENMQLAIARQDESVVKRVQAVVVPAYVQPEELAAARNTTWKVYYAEIGDWKRYDDKVKALDPKPENYYYSEAHVLVQDYGQATEALELAAGYLEISRQQEGDDAPLNLLVAVCQLYMGNEEAARAAAVKCLEMAPASEKQHYQEIVDSLLRELE